MCVRAMLPPSGVAEPVSWRGCAQSFPGRRDQIRLARTLLVSFLDEASGTDDAVLLISELCGNAVTHSASGRPGGQFTVRAEFFPGLCCIQVEVEDQGSNWDGNVSNAESPHGLYLLRKLSSDCGARRGDQGWVTWFTIAAAPPTA